MAQTCSSVWGLPVFPELCPLVIDPGVSSSKRELCYSRLLKNLKAFLFAQPICKLGLSQVLQLSQGVLHTFQVKNNVDNVF